jgi:polysaccharide chain length determinant protein (PEP-CTERM system associated)
VAQEAHSEGNVYLEPRAPGNVPSLYSLQSAYGIQVAQKPGGLGIAWEIWKQRKWLAIFIFLPVFMVVMGVTMVLPAVYQSTATMIIERRQVPEAFVQSTVTGGIDYRLQMLTQEVLSRSRLESLIDRFDLYQDLRQRLPLEHVIEHMRQDILLNQTGGQKGGNQGDSVSALTISYKGRDPQQVAQVANTLASFYIDENLKARERQAVETADFLRGQLDNMKQRQEEEEQRLRQFKERYMGELPEQLQTNLKALENFNAQLRLNGDKQTRASDQRAALAPQLAELAGLKVPSKHTIVMASDPQLNTHVTQREKLQQALAKLSLRYGEKHPATISLKVEIEALDQLIAQKNSTDSDKKDSEQATRAMQNPYAQQLKKEFDKLDTELKTLHTEEQGIRQSVAFYQQRVENTPVRDQELQVLQRDYDIAKGLYQSLLKRQEEAKLAENLEQRQKGEQFRLLEPALPAGRPKEPDRRKLILMGFAGALGLAVGTIILAEKLRPSFHTVDELHAFSQVPVLVNLPYIVTKADIRRRRRRFGLIALCVILSVGLIVGSYVALKGPESLAAFPTQLQRLLK